VQALARMRFRRGTLPRRHTRGNPTQAAARGAETDKNVRASMDRRCCLAKFTRYFIGPSACCRLATGETLGPDATLQCQLQCARTSSAPNCFIRETGAGGLDPTPFGDFTMFWRSISSAAGGIERDTAKPAHPRSSPLGEEFCRATTGVTRDLLGLLPPTRTRAAQRALRSTRQRNPVAYR
jgi:hypothetical protein